MRLGLALASEGRAPHARGERSRLTGAFVLLATRPSFAHDNHVMPRPPSSLTTRTRRPRPSEKIALRVIPGFSPQGHPTLAGPPLGGAGSARPRGWLALDRGICPLGHQAFVWPRLSCCASASVRPCISDAQSASLRENRPSRYPRVSPARPSDPGWPPLGGAGSARP
jgi:hypothetical protein